MPITRAWRASENARRRGEPPVAFVRPRFRRYAEISQRIMALLRRHSPLVEEGGIDEAYFDLSFAGSYEEAAAICRKIKAEIQSQEQLTASVGLGPNKLLAKIASDFKKPDGLTIVTQEEAEAFLAPLPVRKIPGIGPKSEKFLARRGVAKVADLKKFSREELQDLFGKWGLALYDRVRGRHDSPLQEEYEPKSVGEQETFGQDTLEPTYIFERLWGMCRDVWRRLQDEGFRTYRTVVVTVRFADFQTYSRSYTLPYPAQSPRTLVFEAMKLLMPFLDRRENPKGKLIRLIGVRVEKIGR
jgi:nucleotidyltransferase/DNA polymerase involved in DNA repair